MLQRDCTSIHFDKLLECFLHCVKWQDKVGVFGICCCTATFPAFVFQSLRYLQSDWPFWQPFMYSSSCDRCPSNASMYRLLVLLPLLLRNVPTARPWRAWPTASLNTLLICSSEGIHQSGFEAQCIRMNSGQILIKKQKTKQQKQ